MTKLILALAVLSVVGCGSKAVSPAYMKNGQQIFEAKCNGKFRSWVECQQGAGAKCSGNYDEVSNSMEGWDRSLYFTCRQ